MPPDDPLTTTTTTTTTARIATLSPAAAESPPFLTLGQTALVWLAAVLLLIFIFLAALLASYTHSPRQTRCSRDRHRRWRRRRFRQPSSGMACCCGKGSRRLACNGDAGHGDRLLTDGDDTSECVHAVREGDARMRMSQQRQPHYRPGPSTRRSEGDPTAGFVGGGDSGVLPMVHPTPGCEVPDQRKKPNRLDRALLARGGGPGGDGHDTSSAPSWTSGEGGRRGAYIQGMRPEWDEFQLELAAGIQEDAWPFVVPPAPPPSRAGSEEDLLPL